MAWWLVTAVATGFITPWPCNLIWRRASKRVISESTHRSSDHNRHSLHTFSQHRYRFPSLPLIILLLEHTSFNFFYSHSSSTNRLTWPLARSRELRNDLPDGKEGRMNEWRSWYSSVKLFWLTWIRHYFNCLCISIQRSDLRRRNNNTWRVAISVSGMSLLATTRTKEGDVEGEQSFYVSVLHSLIHSLGKKIPFLENFFSFRSMFKDPFTSWNRIFSERNIFSLHQSACNYKQVLYNKTFPFILFTIKNYTFFQRFPKNYYFTEWKEFSFTESRLAIIIILRSFDWPDRFSSLMITSLMLLTSLVKVDFHLWRNWWYPAGIHHIWIQKNLWQIIKLTPSSLWLCFLCNASLW